MLGDASVSAVCRFGHVLSAAMAPGGRVGASREPGGIVLVVPPALQPRLQSLPSHVVCRAVGPNRWEVKPTYPNLGALKRVFAGLIDLDPPLRAAMREINKQRILRKQIVGPPEPRLARSLFGSPVRDIFHRSGCEWAGEIGEKLLVFSSVQAARAKGYRPCKVCLPTQRNPPPPPDHLLPQR
jgi:hypothetical protein